MSHPSCLIIGGTGYVGSAIAKAAVQRGWDVQAVGHEAYKTVRGSRFDFVINANGNSSRFRANQDPQFDFEASALSVHRSIFDFQYDVYALISTVDIYNDPSREEMTAEDTRIDIEALTPYGMHKRLAELFVMRHCQRWQIFRLAQMVGNGLRKGPIYDLLHGQPLWIADDSCLHYMNTQEVARILLDLLTGQIASEVYNLCGRGSVELRRVIELLPAGRREVAQAASERQTYCIDTKKIERLYSLPESWDEVSTFVRHSLDSAT